LFAALKTPRTVRQRGEDDFENQPQKKAKGKERRKEEKRKEEKRKQNWSGLTKIKRGLTSTTILTSSDESEEESPDFEDDWICKSSSFASIFVSTDRVPSHLEAFEALNNDRKARLRSIYLRFFPWAQYATPEAMREDTQKLDDFKSAIWDEMYSWNLFFQASKWVQSLIRNRGRDASNKITPASSTAPKANWQRYPCHSHEQAPYAHCVSKCQFS
jgi:hypothetical protein